MSKQLRTFVLIATVLCLNLFFFNQIGKTGWYLLSLVLLVSTFVPLIPKLKSPEMWLQNGLVLLGSGWMAWLAAQRAQPEVSVALTCGFIGGLLLLHSTNSREGNTLGASEVKAVY